MNDQPSEITVAREILRDAFGRVREYVEGICGAVSDEQVTWRPDPESNSMAWLIWHLTRIQDDHICGITGQEQVWTRDGWYDRFGVPFDPADTGYGHRPEDVAKVMASPDLLDGYHAAVHDLTIQYVDGITSDELARVVDENWDPPVTASVRILSILGDCLAHLGQADYVRGLAERAGAASSA
jgi:uncharacterized protein DUF664